MMSDRLDLNPLNRTVQRLEEGLAEFARHPDHSIIRDGLIQRFEFTYEISHKMLKRFLESVSANPDLYDGMDFATLIRSGNEQGLLLGDWPVWRDYRAMRYHAGYSYNDDMAMAVVNKIPAFLQEACVLLTNLQQRNKEIY